MSVMSRFYAQRLEKFGPTPQGVGWPTAREAMQPYEVMVRLLGIGKGDTVLDVGCGPGLARKLVPGRYVGCDTHLAALQHCDFPVACGSASTFCDDAVDFAVMHGAFNVGYKSLSHVGDVVREMVRVAKKGIAFTVEPAMHEEFVKFSLWPEEEWVLVAHRWLEAPQFRYVGRNMVIWNT